MIAPDDFEGQGPSPPRRAYFARLCQEPRGRRDHARSLLKDGVEIVNDPAEADAVIVNTCSFIDAAQEESVDTIPRIDGSAGKDASGSGRDRVRLHAATVPREELPKLMPEVDVFMGIDQVEQVGALVEQAITRRSDRNRADAAPAPAPKRRSENASRNWRGKGRPDSGGRNPLRGTDQFNRTRKAVQPAPDPSGAVHRSHGPAQLHPSLRHAAIPPDAAAFRLREDREGCNHPCSFCIIPRMRVRTGAGPRRTWSPRRAS